MKAKSTPKKEKLRIDVQVRWLISQDMNQVLEIEEASFNNPWTIYDFKSALRDTKTVAFCAVHIDKMFGFVVYKMEDDHVGIVDLAVHPHYRRLSVGRTLVDKLKEKLLPRRPRLTALVRDSNLPAQLFYRSQGFLAIEYITGAFGEEDGIGMNYELVKDGDS